MGTCVGAVDSNRIFDRILTPARHVVLTYFHTYMPGSIRGLFCAGQETNPALRHNRASPAYLASTTWRTQTMVSHRPPVSETCTTAANKRDWLLWTIKGALALVLDSIPDHPTAPATRFYTMFSLRVTHKSIHVRLLLYIHT
jgi:hypothetical protein